MYVVLVCVQRSCWWVSSGTRRSVCTGGSATCRRHRAPIDSPSPGPGFCGGRACVKSTHSQHSSTSPAGEMSLAHRAPITRFVRLPISSPPGPLAPSLALLLPNHHAICCYCKYLDRLKFIRSTPWMSSMNSFPYSHNANGWMSILTLLGPEPLIVIIGFRCQETVSVVSTNLNFRVNRVSNNSKGVCSLTWQNIQLCSWILTMCHLPSDFLIYWAWTPHLLIFLGVHCSAAKHFKYVLIDQKTGNIGCKNKGFCLALKWSVYAKGSRVGWLAFH